MSCLFRRKDPTLAMTEPDTLAALTDLFRELFMDDTIVLTPATTADDVDGWDSFTHLNMIVAVESRFRIKMTTAEVEGLTNIGDLITVIQRKPQTAAPTPT